MFLKRKIEETLMQWKKESFQKAICIVGARQIGKSTSVRHFAQREYSQFIEINFIAQPNMTEIFAGPLDAKTLWTNITAYTKLSVVPGDTLLLLDEIQECPNARTAVKFLVEDGRAAIAETGSMLGVKLKEVRSYPVGFEKIIPMYPLDFEEYLWNAGIPEETLLYVKNCFQKKEPVSPAIHTLLIRSFQEYLVVGGMPEAVVRYLGTDDISQVLDVQKAVLGVYVADISKYAPLSERLKIQEIFNAIPSQLDSKNRRFTLSQVIPKAKLSRTESSFIWLSEAGIALPCYNVTEPVQPLILSEKRNLFKLFLCDTGLLCAASLNSVQAEILKGDLNINQGSILENAFAQQLLSNGFSLYYYNSKSIGEIDFVCSRDGQIDLLEIKSGKNYRTHPALNRAANCQNWKFGQKIVFCSSNIEEKDGVLYLPWYCISFYRDTPFPSSMIVQHTDLSSLMPPESWQTDQSKSSEK